MSGLGAYLWKVTAGAVVCGILTSISDKLGSHSRLIKMLCLLFMTVVILCPLADFRLEDITSGLSDIGSDADAVVEAAKADARQEISVDIQRRLEAYIQEQADVFGADLEIEVEITTTGIPTPCGVRLYGNVSPYAKARLSDWIGTALGIDLEAQEWINKT